MSNFFSNLRIRQSLSLHSWLGLWFCGLIYLICLSGSLTVLFEEFERLEQPYISEYDSFPVELIAPSIAEYNQRVQKPVDTLYIVLPTEGLPRTHITDGDQEWFIAEDGSFEDQPHTPWTSMLKELHTNLHLPHIIGMSIVGFMGIIIFTLILSGVIAHPRIFRDAFKLRLGNSERQQQMDLHNRLGVWGIPFHLMISLTGAFIGLSSVLIAIGSMLYFNNNQDAMVNAIYGGDPVVSSQGEDIDYLTALSNLKAIAPDAKPIYLAVHHLGTEQQLLEIAAIPPQRLTYSEMYRFNPQGDLIDQQGLSNGPIGRQVAYSTYRLHFGHFDSFWVKILYVFMGFSLTYVCVTGTNIWLEKRKYISWVNHVWKGWVWGIPLALVCSYLATLIELDAIITFWGLLLSGTFFYSLIKTARFRTVSQI
jgi:uncharacterized iron-regulated membrane protein